MSWVGDVNWQQLNRDLQNIEMLSLQQEQNRILQASLAQQKAAAERAKQQEVRAAAQAANARAQQAEAEAKENEVDPEDADSQIHMADKHYSNQNFEEALSFYFGAVACLDKNAIPGSLCNKIAYTLKNLNREPQARFWWERGANSGDTSCANTMIFSYLIPEQKWAEIDGYVATAVANDSGAETTNAISNGAISLYLRGTIDDAVTAFKAVLDRSNKSSSAEAYWWLSKIFAKKGETALSESYYLLCQQSGGYAAPSWAH